MAAKNKKDTTSKSDESTPKYVTVEKDSASPAVLTDAPASPAPEETKTETPAVAATSTTDLPKTPSSFSLLDADKPEDSKPSSETDSPDVQSAPSVAEVTEEPKETVSDEKASVDTGDVDGWLDGDKTEDKEEGSGKSKKIAIIIIIFLVIAGVVAGGVYYYRNNLQSEEVPEVIISEPTPKEEPEAPVPAEESEEVDLTEVSVSILNGSGIPGEAGKVEALLENAGFEDIETGNADSYDFLDTGVSVKKGISSFVFNSIEESLAEGYSVVESDELDEDSTYDVIIIVGSEKPEAEPTEAPTDTPTPVPEEE